MPKSKYKKKKMKPKPEITEMGWEVHPEGIYKMLKYFDKYEGIKKIIVTEFVKKCCIVYFLCLSRTPQSNAHIYTQSP